MNFGIIENSKMMKPNLVLTTIRKTNCLEKSQVAAFLCSQFESGGSPLFFSFSLFSDGSASSKAQHGNTHSSPRPASYLRSYYQFEDIVCSRFDGFTQLGKNCEEILKSPVPQL